MQEQVNFTGLSSDLTFLTNEAGMTLRDCFGVLLAQDTRFFDCLVGYFFISGFYKLYPVLEKVEKIRILVGLQTDQTASYAYEAEFEIKIGYNMYNSKIFGGII
jgi:hypothetical protein